jgi:2,3-bisphosphoglycerate-independent phosphoglycerate mutase
MNPVLMVFLDGVGIGRRDYESNPFFKFGFKTFEHFFGDIPSLEKPFLTNSDNYLFPADPCMGVPGFPQSGTGQVSIFCGINAPAFVGKHFGPFPYSTTIPVLKTESIFAILKGEGYNVSFANAYPSVFFDYLKSGKQRLSTTSLSCRLIGLRLNRITDLRKGRALTAEISNERWNLKLGYNLPVIKPSTAAKRLLRIAAGNAFTLYEFYLTDHIGHGRYEGNVQKMITLLDDFLFSLLSELNREKMTLIICSDHGNFEDLSVKTHTLNPALTLTAGLKAHQMFREIKDLSNIKGAILKYCR